MDAVDHLEDGLGETVAYLKGCIAGGLGFATSVTKSLWLHLLLRG
jgi:hypothetical protein